LTVIFVRTDSPPAAAAAAAVTWQRVKRHGQPRIKEIGRTAAAAAVTTTTATATTTARIGDVDANPTTVEIRVVHTVNGSVGFILTAESYETESTRALSLAITHDDRVNNVAKFRKGMAQRFIIGIPAQIANMMLQKKKSLSAAALPPVLLKNGKKRRGAEKTDTSAHD